MRFRTKFDRWLVVLLAVAAIATCVVLPALRFLAPGDHPPPLWVVFLPLALWSVVLPCTLPQYYDVREDGLFIRQGWRRALIPYASLAELQSVSDSRSAAVFSMDRVLVVTTNGRRWVIAVAEEERFLAEVLRRSPQLERRSFGLGAPLSSPTVF